MPWFRNIAMKTFQRFLASNDSKYEFFNLYHTCHHQNPSNIAVGSYKKLLNFFILTFPKRFFHYFSYYSHINRLNKKSLKKAWIKPNEKKDDEIFPFIYLLHFHLPIFSFFFLSSLTKCQQKNQQNMTKRNQEEMKKMKIRVSRNAIWGSFSIEIRFNGEFR